MLQLLQESVYANLSLIDVIDITMMSFILYRAFLIIRGTRAFESLIGLLFLGGLYVLAQYFGLSGIYWMLDKFFLYLVIALLILFQNDIRRGLARAGGRFFQGFSSTSEAFLYEDVVRTAFALASRRIGALIVIERGASLDEFVETGLRLDAYVSQELMTSIFHPTSPLHDGAAVIQKGRISAAKVFLPLSLSKNIARYYGTRHRAALGLSEETDAVVISVSEERGAVSLVMAGALSHVEDVNSLRQHLQEIFQPEQGSTRRRGR